MLRMLAVCLFLAPMPLWAEMKVAIRSDFPGGNVLIKKNEGNEVHLAPDLRGGPAWFYWNFEAEVSEAGTVRFKFPSPTVGVRGPAISHDEGKSWKWLGAEHVQYAPPVGDDKKVPRFDVFAFAFTAAKQKVRFAVAIPYLHRDLETFLTRHKANPHLTRSVLTQSRLGQRPVDLVQIGKPGPGVESFLITARHHACESMASYVLEGMMQEALSDSPLGIEFRKKYVAYIVPIVDRDGVEAGDQGKNRLPKDYNRDYGADSIYPEIKAIQELGVLKKVHYSLDIHCPYLKGDIHEAFYWVGLGLPHIKDNLREWNAWIKEEKPGVVMTPLDLLSDPKKAKGGDPRINSHHFALRPGCVFAATLEVPYTQPNLALDADMARAYGVGMLRAWTRTKFLLPDQKREPWEEASFLVGLRSQARTITEKEALDMDSNAFGSGLRVLDVETGYLLALAVQRNKRIPEAEYLTIRADRPLATAQQKANLKLLHTQLVASWGSTDAEIDTSLTKALSIPYASHEHQAKALEAVVLFYERKKEYEKSLGHARKQLAFVATYEKGKMLNRIAGFHDQLKMPDDAVKARQEAVAFLRERAGKLKERSAFGAAMSVDLFDALVGIPTATLEEKKAAAQAALDHEIVAAAIKDRIRKKLAEIEKK